MKVFDPDPATRRVDDDSRCRAKAQRAPVYTPPRMKIESIAVPGTTKLTVGHAASVEGTQPVRTFDRMSDQLALPFDDAKSLTGEFESQRQSRPQFIEGSEFERLRSPDDLGLTISERAFTPLHHLLVLIPQ